jgi:hypothetical protein
MSEANWLSEQRRLALEIFSGIQRELLSTVVRLEEGDRARYRFPALVVHDVIPQVPGTPENHQDSRSCELINVAKQYLKPILPRLFEEVFREQVLDRPHGIPKGHSFDAYNCGMIGILLAIAANGAAAI